MSRGVATAGAGAGLLLCAFAFGASTLFVPALALIALPALVTVWIWLAARTARIGRVLEVDRVVEDQPVEARVQVEGLLGLPGAEVQDPLAGGSLAIFSSPGTRQFELRVISRFPTRGRVVLPTPRLWLRDGLGLAERVTAAPGQSQELLVLPRTERVSWREGAGRLERRSAGMATSPEPMGATEIDGLRQYRPGTPASRIHWAALARGAGLLERRLLADSDQSPLVVLDARGAGPSRVLDAAVRAAASLTLELARRGGCDLLLGGQRRPVHVSHDLGGWSTAHVQLALVEGGPDALVPLMGTRRDSAALFYVAARPLTRLPEDVGGRPAVALLVLPDELILEGHGPAALRVSGCSGFLMGAGLRRASRLGTKAAA